MADDTTAPATAPACTLRAPSTLPASSPSPSIHPPPLSFLAGPWNVTHSTLPMWKKNKNVVITYTPLPSTSTSTSTSTTPARLDDLVTYQPLSSKKTKTVKGIDKPFSVPNTAAPPPPPQNENEGENADANGAEQGETKTETETKIEYASLAYAWRGKGLLAIASSKWEILGWADEPGTNDNAWVVTFFAKTLFTPAGVDVYSRRGKLLPETLEGIKGALAALGGQVATLAEDLFEIAMDDA